MNKPLWNCPDVEEKNPSCFAEQYYKNSPLSPPLSV